LEAVVRLTNPACSIPKISFKKENYNRPIVIRGDNLCYNKKAILTRYRSIPIKSFLFHVKHAVKYRLLATKYSFTRLAIDKPESHLLNVYSEKGHRKVLYPIIPGSIKTTQL
jgi:hypothetical protein